MTPSAGLFLFHRHHLSNVLILGGSSDERIHVALSFHRHSALRRGPFVCIDCEIETPRLRAGLHAWLSPGRGTPIDDPIGIADHGTLFLDSIGVLPRETQRLLHAFTCRHQDAAPSCGERRWRGRLVVGSAESLTPRVRLGHFDVSLYDALDKVRFDLGARPRSKRNRPWQPWAARPTSMVGVGG